MDHFTKALEHAQRDGTSVREWVQPERPRPYSETANEVYGRGVALDIQWMQGRHLLCEPGHEDPVVADTYRLLRTQVLQRLRPHGWKRLAITSPGPKAGKTLTSINLAISVARNGKQRVVLIDADLRKPSIAHELGIEVDAGLIDYLGAETALEDVALNPDSIPNLTIIPGRRVESIDAKPELLGSERMQRLLDQVVLSIDPALVIVDLPPVLVGDDAIRVGEYIDGVLLIIEEGSTEVEELKRAAELLESFNLIGSVLNKSVEKRKGMAGYYYTYANDGAG